MAKIKDTTIRFDKNKHYEIGVLQANSSPSDVPERFSQSPRKLSRSGADLIGLGLKSCRDYLSSDGCNSYFKPNSTICFFEVEYGNGDPIYKHIYSGTPIPPLLEKGLSDEGNQSMSPSSMLFPRIPDDPSRDASNKLLYQTQSEQISYYRKTLDDLNREFKREQSEHLQKIQDLQSQILDLNITINKLSAENEALKIRYEESSKNADRWASLASRDDDVQPSLGDKAVSVLDNMLGEGTSQMLAGQLIGGLSGGISKGIEFLIDYARKKKGMESPVLPADSQPQAAPQPIQQQQPIPQQQPIQQQQQQPEYLDYEKILRGQTEQQWRN
jgi:hypothetical protein